MARQVKDVHHAFPDRFALEDLAHGDGLGERGGTAVHALDGVFSSLSVGSVADRIM
jgi:hypothetical protein